MFQSLWCWGKTWNITERKLHLQISAEWIKYWKSTSGMWYVEVQRKNTNGIKGSLKDSAWMTSSSGWGKVHTNEKDGRGSNLLEWSSAVANSEEDASASEMNELVRHNVQYRGVILRITHCYSVHFVLLVLQKDVCSWIYRANRTICMVNCQLPVAGKYVLPSLIIPRYFDTGLLHTTNAGATSVINVAKLLTHIRRTILLTRA